MKGLVGVFSYLQCSAGLVAKTVKTPPSPGKST